MHFVDSGIVLRLVRIPLTYESYFAVYSAWFPMIMTKSLGAVPECNFAEHDGDAGDEPLGQPTIQIKDSEDDTQMN